MIKIQNSKQYDLEDRTLQSGLETIRLAKHLKHNEVNKVLSNQFVRSGTSTGANYREANETQTKKDFCFRIRICRKEAKETIYWLELIKEANPEHIDKCNILIEEYTQQVKIFASIAEKAKVV